MLFVLKVILCVYDYGIDVHIYTVCMRVYIYIYVCVCMPCMHLHLHHELRGAVMPEIYNLHIFMYVLCICSMYQPNCLQSSYAQSVKLIPFAVLLLDFALFHTISWHNG